MSDNDDLIPRRVLGGVLMGRRPAIIFVDAEGRVVESSGELALYGLGGLRVGDAIADTAPYLDGMFPAADDNPVRLECLAPVDGVYCDVHVVAGGDGRSWVVLLDCTEATELRRALQQRGNDLALLKEKLERQNAELAEAHAKSDELLGKILPRAVADGLRSGSREIVGTFDGASVAFAEVTGFAYQTANLSPAEQIAKLRAIFSRFDELARETDVVPVKTQGAIYIAAAGLPIAAADHAVSIARFALDIQQALLDIDSGSEHPFTLRIGVATGPVVAGVIGAGRLAYDVWGRTVTTAEALQHSAPPGSIQVDEATHDTLADTFRFEERGAYYVKGGGEVITYLLTGRREG